jgi:hypothetical protein
MAQRVQPIIGGWYAHRDKGQLFQVVAMDDEDGFVELQNFDGDVDEVDMDTWYAMPLDPAEPPEDSTGPVDEPEDVGYEDGALGARERVESLEDIGGLEDDVGLDDDALDDEGTDLSGGLH